MKRSQLSGIAVAIVLLVVACIPGTALWYNTICPNVHPADNTEKGGASGDYTTKEQPSQHHSEPTIQQKSELEVSRAKSETRFRWRYPPIHIKPLTITGVALGGYGSGILFHPALAPLGAVAGGLAGEAVERFLAKQNQK